MTTGLSVSDMFQLKSQVLYRDNMKAIVSHDLLAALIKKIRSLRTKQSAMPQKVTWDQVAGLDEAKNLIRETLDFPLNRKNQLRSTLGRRTGILLHGPPGTGKTLLAKAIATEYQLSFMAVKGPELMSMYIGETESNIRGLFQEARLNQPTVLFFDELDSLATRRGEDADSGGITDRIVAQLMVEIDRCSEDADCTVFLIGATNRPDLIDPALLRPGRIDKAVYLGAPTSKTEQVAILKASCRDMQLHDSVRFEDLDKLTLEYSPADLANVCRSAMRLAIKNKIGELEKGVGLSTDLIQVTQDNFTEACKLVKPSL
jgi:peroxin-6